MKIGCDICNTIADVMGSISKHFSIPISELNKKYDYHEHFGVPKEFFKSATGLNIFDTCKPFSGAIDVLQKLSKENKIYYITSRPVEAANVTHAWLRRHGFPYGPLFFYKDKLLIVEALKVDLMIEDAPNVIKELVQNGKKVITKSYGYNTEFEEFGATFSEWNKFSESRIKYHALEGIECQK